MKRKSGEMKKNNLSAYKILKNKLILIIVPLVAEACLIIPLHYLLGYSFLDVTMCIAMFPVGQLCLNILATA